MGIKHKKQPANNQQPAERTTKERLPKEYLRLLYSRVAWLGGSIIIAAIVGFEFKDIFQSLVTMPLNDLSLINLPTADDMTTTWQMSLLVAALVGLPLTAYHAYRFVEPMLDKGSAYAAKLFGASSLLVAAAIIYAFSLVIPTGLHGMAAYGQDAQAMHVTTQSFLGFAVVSLLVVAASFQLPLAIIFIGNLRSFSKKFSLRLQAVIIPLIAVAAWIATPFTTLNRGIAGIILIAVPAIVLFEAGLFWARRHVTVPRTVEAFHQPARNAAQLPVEQPVRQTVPVFVSPKVIAETEELQPFPDEMFDGMFDDSANTATAPAISQPRPVVMQQPKPAPVSQYAAPHPVVRPIAATQHAPVRAPQSAGISAPRFTASFSPVSKAQPTVPFRSAAPAAHPQQMTRTLRQQPVQPRPVQSTRAPQQIVPFGMAPARPFGATM